MPRISRRMQSRGYELDARHRVPPAMFARYCEHMRWAVLCDESAGLAPLLAQGRKLVVRAQDLVLFEPLVHDEELELSAELAQVGRTSLKLVHEVLRVRDARLIARALVTGVLLDAQNRPTAVPVEVAQQLAPDAQVPASPALLAPPAQVWSCAWAVRPSDIDGLGHVNQSRYIELVDDVRELCVRAGGYGAESERGRSHPARIVVDYRKETRLGSELRVDTWADDSGALGFLVHDAATGAAIASARIDLA